MKLRQTFLFLIIFIFLLKIVSAIDINEFKTDIAVYRDGMTKVVNEITLDSTRGEELIYIPAYNPESIIITDQEGNLKYATFSGFITITPKKKIKSYQLRLQYLTDALTSKNDGEWVIQYEYPSLKALNYNSLKNNQIRINLPSKTALKYLTNGGVVFIEDDKLVSEWHPSLKEGVTTTIESYYVLNPEKNSNLKDYFLIILTTILVIILCIFSINYFPNKYFKKISKGKKAIFDMLNDPEKQVVELLLKSKDKKLTQSKVFVQTGISKPTLSRTIRRLATKNIIEIRPIGNTNLIMLTKEFCKK